MSISRVPLIARDFRLALPSVRVDSLRQMAASFVPKGWLLPEPIARRLGDQAGRQRLVAENGHLLLILHEPPRAEDDEQRQPFLLWGDDAGNWKSHPGAGGLAGLAGLLHRYHQAIDALDQAAEAARTPVEFFSVVRQTHPLLRATRNLLTALEEARKGRPSERRLIVLRDEAVSLERAMDLVSSDAKAAMEFSIAQNGEEQAQAARAASAEARRLNRLAAFFFPLATLVAVFGMNPPREVLEFAGFWLVLGIGVLIGAVVLALISTKRSQ